VFICVHLWQISLAKSCSVDPVAIEQFMRSSDVVVIGGGVIGLSIAYALAKRGVLATVIDRAVMGRAASWAGAGLLPPFIERRTTSPMVDLRSWSSVLYREWSREIRERTGLDNGYRVSGGIDVALHPAEVADLKTAAGRWRVEGIRFEPLDPRDFVAVEPALNPAIAHAFLLPDRAQIRNPWHLRALEETVNRMGVKLVPHVPVRSLKRAGRRVLAVETETGDYPCGQVVMAAGAWSGGLLEAVDVHLPTTPLKGQIVLFRHDQPILRRIIEHGKMYLVPRDDGRILMGATEEDAGFDTRSTPEAIRSLIDEALLICPALAKAEVEDFWAGLRPGSVDTRPYLGAVSEYDNLIVATGHKRAGLQLAPATGEVIANLLTGQPPGIDLTGFEPDRSPGPDEDMAFRS
jgi:glycine oxidase